jgi:REP element-mobilizing transposase RayT
MARPIRVEYEGAYYHIVARGNERREIFRSDEDRQILLKTLQQMLGEFGVVLHCYCLMPNHYHLVVQTPRANLSRAIGWLQTTYTIRYNRIHKRSGHLFQGRYKAHLVGADEYARQLVKYIHLNPVRPPDKRAELDPAKKEVFERYPWSSHFHYSGRKKAGWLNTDWLSYWGRNRRTAQREYRQEILGLFGKPVQSPWDQLRGGLVLGGEPLWEKVKGLMWDKSGIEEIRWKQYQGNKEIQKWLLKKENKEKDDRVRVWMRVRLGGQKKVEVAREFGYKDGSAVIHVVNRLERIATKDKKLNRKLARLRSDLSCFKS